MGFPEKAVRKVSCTIDPLHFAELWRVTMSLLTTDLIVAFDGALVLSRLGTGGPGLDLETWKAQGLGQQILLLESRHVGS
jgi:hypothetical protein